MYGKLGNLVSLIGILGILLSASVVSAQPPGRGPGDPEAMNARMEARMKWVQEKLNLTAEQQELLKTHRARHRSAAGEIFASSKAKREALRVELEKPELNMEAVDRLHAELKEAHARMADHRLEGILEVREILTPEQFTLFLEITGKGRHGQGRRGMGMGQGPPPLSED